VYIGVNDVSTDGSAIACCVFDSEFMCVFASSLMEADKLLDVCLSRLKPAHVVRQVRSRALKTTTASSTR
jgi:hypothetical protein